MWAKGSSRGKIHPHQTMLAALENFYFAKFGGLRNRSMSPKLKQ
jgi:hypothetical protein